MSFQHISVIGLGYIGLPTAAIIASRGPSVLGIDISQAVVDTINGGGVHIVEPDLDIAVRSAVTSGKFRAAREPKPADVFIIAVPTPFKADKTPDLSFVYQAGDMIAPVLAPGNLVILESTSPVSTTARLAQRLATSRPDLRFPGAEEAEEDIFVAHCPERVLPGHILRELINNDRIIGGLSPRSARRAADFYALFVQGERILTDASTAELCKLTENAYRDVNIAFANEMARIASRLGVDVWELISLANRHPRVNILQPGPGVGGHCISVDPWFIVDSAPEEAQLIRTAREINDAQPDRVIAQVAAAVTRHSRPVIACLGLTYKADIDDLRESPALEVILGLSDLDLGPILAVEPHIDALPADLVEKGVILSTLEEALAQAQVLVLLVDHKAFRQVTPTELQAKTLIDTRGLWLWARP